MVISLCCGKGGTGKTTSTCNIGAALAEHSKRVLLIDNDQQGSLTLSLGYEPSALPSTLANLMFQAIDMPELLNETIERTIQQASDNLHLIPANKKLAGILSRLVSMQNTRAMFPNDNDGIAPEKVLSAIVEWLKTRYDYILIDCSPHLDLQMINALTASDRVIIPTQAHFLDTAGLNDTIEIIHKVQQSLNPALKQADILLTMFMPRTILNQISRQNIQERYGEQMHVFEQPIDYSIKVAEHPAIGVSLLEYAPQNTAAISYRAVAEEVMQHG